MSAGGAERLVADRLAAERTSTQARIEDLTRELDDIAAGSEFTTDDDEHDPEGATIGYERALVQGLLAGARRDLGALNAAEQRLRAGTYGSCVRCGRVIDPARLEALPAAATCIRCADARR
ncbi:MAG: suppressor protein DnaK [Pseudonocardia sp.]|jgi:RNA polymerase-binding transcription factor DksA|nr:suppressor protein DnaK [Pseudonocardia sp.]